MNQMEYDNPRAASELIERIDTIIQQGETSMPTSIVDNESDWYIRVSLHLRRTAVVIRFITLQAYLETIGSDISDSDLTNTQLYQPGKTEYEFKIHVEKGRIPTGLYRVSSAIHLIGDNNRQLLVGFSDMGLVQVYSSKM